MVEPYVRLVAVSPVVEMLLFVTATAVSLGASWLLVSRLERVGTGLGLSEGLLGLLAALAADAPEVTAAVTAVVSHQQDLGAGVVVGSNVFNLAALLGLGAVVAGRIGFHRRVVLLGGTVAVWVAVVCVAVSVGWLPVGAGLGLGGLIVAAYAATLGRRRRRMHRLCLPVSWTTWLDQAVHEEETELDDHHLPEALRRSDLATVLIAVLVVVAASVVMERSASSLGSQLGFTQIVTGGLVLAAVTSLPNAVAAVYLARRGRGTATLSTALNSNTLNVIAGLLLPATILGLGRPTEQTDLIVAWYLGLTLLTLALAYAISGLTRATGYVIITGYALFVAAVLVGTRTPRILPQLTLAACALGAAGIWLLLGKITPGRPEGPSLAWRLAVGAPLLVAVADAACGHRLVLMGLLVVGPCCGLLTRCGSRAALATCWALLLAAALGVPDGIWATSRQAVFVLAVLIVGVVSTIGATILSRQPTSR
jgi:cation:H+ antiporter